MNDDPAIVLVEPPSKRLKRAAADVKYFILGKTSHLFLAEHYLAYLDNLTTFCCFVGHGRSGGTLVGALLNAHPNIVMSNELNALRRLATGLTAKQLYRVICLVSARQVRRGSMGGGGYSYAVKNQWQGRHKDLSVIGDRKAGATAYEVVRNPRLLEILDRKVQLRKKFIHVIRNPFDTITTTFHKTLPRPGESPDDHLSREITNYFVRCSAVRLIDQTFGADSIYYLHHEQLIADPMKQLKALCEFVGVEPIVDYLNDCSAILQKSPNQSRKLLAWPERHIAAMYQGMENCPWLCGYAINS
jgi:hypothetical protein